MSDPFLDPIMRRIEQANTSGMRLGTVTAVDAPDGSITVSLGGDVVDGVRWIGTTPVVADIIAVARMGAAWVALGKLSNQLAETTIYESATILPAATFPGTWDGAAWTWTTAADGLAGQGLHTPVADETLAGVWYLPPVAEWLPAGATVTAAKVRLTRWAPEVGGSDLVTPGLRMHAYTAVPSGVPVWTGSAWGPGALGRGQTGVWDLPSDWLTALVAGTSTGVGVTSSARMDYTRFSGVQVEIAYSAPAPA